MKRTYLRLFFYVFCACSISSTAFAAVSHLAWDANSENDLAGYKVYRGPASGSYDMVKDVGNVVAYSDSNLNDNTTYYYAVTAYDFSGNESAKSAEVSFNSQTSQNGLATVDGTSASSGCGYASRFHFLLLCVGVLLFFQRPSLKLL